MEIYFRRKAIGPPFEEGEEMKFEGARVTTYKNWPKRASMWPTRLARAGLYYTGSEDQVACFSCSGRLKTWESRDSPMTEHKRFFPQCRFVNGRDSTNVPLGETTETPTPHSGRHDIDSSNVPLRETHDAPDGAQSCHSGRRNNKSVYYGRLAAGIYQLGGPTSLSCRTNEIDQQHQRGQYESLPSSSARHAPGSSHRITKMLSVGTPLVTDRSFNNQDLQEMKQESKRLDSFMDWPNFANVRKENLAKAGLYYLGIADRVKCAFCNGILRNWERRDKEMVEHRKFFPNCAFVRNSHAAGNVTIEEENVSPQQALQNVASNPSRSSQLGVMTVRPAHQRFAVESVRLTSFTRWPRTIRPFPEDLAKAGFFYTGPGDNVKCFFCDGGLRNWERGDDPWKEHARWFPRCNYVKTVKGEEFILRIRSANPGQSSATSGSTNTAGCNLTGNISGTRRSPVQPRDVRARMDTSRVQLVLEMGFPREIVYNVIQNRLVTIGDDFPNVQSLLEAVFAEMETTPTSSSSNQQRSNSAATVETEFGNTAAAAATTTGTTQAQTSTTATTTGTTQAQTSTTATTTGTTQAQTSTTGIGAAGGSATKEHVSSKEATQITADGQRLLCKICLDDEANILFLPCGHLCSCARCAPALRNCAICRAIIKGTVRVYLT